MVNVSSVVDALGEVLSAKEFPLEIYIPDDYGVKYFSESLRAKLINSTYDRFSITNASTEQDKILYIRKI
jgi:hypothetical protein